MCSIAGFYNSNRDFNTEQERYSYISNDMNKALAHRGSRMHRIQCCHPTVGLLTPDCPYVTWQEANSP